MKRKIFRGDNNEHMIASLASDVHSIRLYCDNNVSVYIVYEHLERFPCVPGGQ